MRRHTQESKCFEARSLHPDSDYRGLAPEPYVCDFPGCGKAFAITGALTIHKRTHNGHKPFKCSYCERCVAGCASTQCSRMLIARQCSRAFAESSNLSKHVRIYLYRAIAVIVP